MPIYPSTSTSSQRDHTDSREVHRAQDPKAMFHAAVADLFNRNKLSLANTYSKRLLHDRGRVSLSPNRASLLETMKSPLTKVSLEEGQCARDHVEPILTEEESGIWIDEYIAKAVRTSETLRCDQRQLIAIPRYPLDGETSTSKDTMVISIFLPHNQRWVKQLGFTDARICSDFLSNIEKQIRELSDMEFSISKVEVEQEHVTVFLDGRQETVTFHLEELHLDDSWDKLSGTVGDCFSIEIEPIRADYHNPFSYQHRPFYLSSLSAAIDRVPNTQERQEEEDVKQYLDIGLERLYESKKEEILILIDRTREYFADKSEIDIEKVKEIKIWRREEVPEDKIKHPLHIAKINTTEAPFYVLSCQFDPIVIPGGRKTVILDDHENSLWQDWEGIITTMRRLYDLDSDKKLHFFLQESYFRGEDVPNRVS